MVQESTIALIKSHEGNIPYVYNDADGTVPRKRILAAGGNLTCGIGFNLQNMNIPQPVIDYWLFWLLDNVYLPVLNNIFSRFSVFSQNRKDALADMIYNLGPSRFNQFQNMIRDIKNNDWESASSEALSSGWSKQVGERANVIAKMLKDG